MTSESIYEYMHDSSINDNLVCEICHNPLIDPRSTPCQHIFCEQCVMRWLEKTSSCPACRNPLFINELKTTERIVIRMLDQLKVKCTRCGQINLERGHLNDHVEKMCINSIVSCPSADINCPWKGPRYQLNDHFSVCMFEPLRSILSNIIDENRQLKQKVQQLEAINQHERNVQTPIDPQPAQLAASISSTNVTGKLEQFRRRKQFLDVLCFQSLWAVVIRI